MLKSFDRINLGILQQFSSLRNRCSILSRVMNIKDVIDLKPPIKLRKIELPKIILNLFGSINSTKRMDGSGDFTSTTQAESSTCDIVSEQIDNSEENKRKIGEISTEKDLFSELPFDSESNEPDLINNEGENIIQLPSVSCISGDNTVNTKKKDVKGSTKSSEKKKKIKKERKAPPNYFVAVRIQNNKILTKLKSVQEAITNVKEELKPTLISTTKFHLTLCVLRIEDETQLNKATQLLESCKERLKENNSLHSLHLTIEGLDHFKNQVVFAKVKEDENFLQLQKIADTVISCFDGSDMLIKDHEEFTPHLTIAKMSKAPFLRKKKITKIPVDSYNNQDDETFGVEEINTIQLLSMTIKDEDGYYHCSKEILLPDST